MNTMNADYQTDRVALVQTIPETPSAVTVLCASESWSTPVPDRLLVGAGIQRVIDTHRQFEGALTLSRFRRSSIFSDSEWQSLWDSDLLEPATALLSVPVCPSNAPVAYLWLVADNGSREWSSHDRDLAEEEAVLLARVLDREMLR
ncbi:MAG: GAF domain-containing protein [Deltaproteobacteria bacterium]|nr:GAF domain-containing protein [Deltaproteobacteria bacterium]